MSGKTVSGKLVSGSSVQKSQVFSDGHRPQVDRGAGRCSRARARAGPRHSLTGDHSICGIPLGHEADHRGLALTVAGFRRFAVWCHRTRPLQAAKPKTKIRSCSVVTGYRDRPGGSWCAILPYDSWLHDFFSLAWYATAGIDDASCN